MDAEAKRLWAAFRRATNTWHHEYQNVVEFLAHADIGKPFTVLEVRASMKDKSASVHALILAAETHGIVMRVGRMPIGTRGTKWLIMWARKV